MQVKPYPHVLINVQDNSIYEPVSTLTLPVFRPFFPMTAQKGEVNKPAYYPSLFDAIKTLGAETFNPISEYYSPEAAYLLKIFENACGAFIARVSPTNAEDPAVATPSTNAALILEAWVANRQIPQYQTDATGARVLVDGAYVRLPEDISGTEVVWTVRALATGETVETVGDTTKTETVTVEGAEVVYTAYPIMVFYTDNPGLWGNDTGFSFFYDSSANDPQKVDRNNVLFYTLAPVQKSSTGVVEVVKDKYSSTMNTFTFKPNLIDPATTAPLSIDKVLANAYVGGKLPYSIRVFNSNIKTIGDLMITTETQSNYVSWLFNWTFDSSGLTMAGTWLEATKDITVADNSSLVAGMIVEGTGVPADSYVTAVNQNGTVVTINNTLPAAGNGVSLEFGAAKVATWRADANTISLIDNSDIEVGMAIETAAGSALLGIPAGAKVTSVNQNGTDITIDRTTTAEGTNVPVLVQYAIQQRTGTWLADSTEITLDNVVGITAGMAVEDLYVSDGEGGTELAIPTGTTVVSVDGNVITISQATLVAGTGELIAVATPTNYQYAVDADYDGWRVNILTGIDPDTDAHYQRLIVSTSHDDLLTAINSGVPTDEQASIFIGSRDFKYYLKGGDDGTFAAGGKEAYISALLAGTLENPDGTVTSLEDPSRYPFNYLFDTGYTLDTKYNLIDFQNIRGDVRTSVCALVPGGTNDMLTNISTGTTLRDYAILQSESILKGTQGCRTSVWVQSGRLVGDTDDNWYGSNIWDAWVHAKFQNRTFLDRVPEGLPNSACNMFREWNWVPGTEEIKALLWEQGLNYTQYYNMNEVHFPACRSVYTYETSVLVNNTFVDFVTYTKQEIRASWHKFVGMSLPFVQLSTVVRDDLVRRIQHLANGMYKFTVTVYQTEEDVNLGYVARIIVDIEAPGTTRVWQVDIPVNREGYGS